MPILHVRALEQKNPDLIQKALKAVCIAIGEAYGCKAGHVWATWEEISPGFYVEGESPAMAQPESSHPPIAELICFEGKDPKTIERVLEVAAEALSRALGIPGNIFMTYREAKSGQVIAGDGIIRRS